MNKIVALAFLVGGIVLLYFGYREAQSFSSGFNRIFTGSPSSKATWMIIAGIIATVAGLLSLARNSK
ncbi:MAG: hypothetical protein JWR69_3265 [Pedosphaera sp.]|nr:hypothetical protein [Pedosphaera sp.]